MVEFICERKFIIILFMVSDVELNVNSGFYIKLCDMICFIKWGIYCVK